MPPLPLASALLTRLPWLSAQGRAVINVLVCENGRAGSADLVAARLGLRTRFQLARLLRREGLPPYEMLTGWASVLYWMFEADRGGTTLLAIARRGHMDPAVCYRLIRRLTGLRWSELRRVGTAAVLLRFLTLCRPCRRGNADRSRRRTAVTENESQLELRPIRNPMLPLRLQLDGAPFDVAIHRSHLAYITRTHAAAVERLDLTTGRFVETIPVGCVPSAITFDATGTRAYVSIQYCDRIAVIDAKSHAPVEFLSVPGDPFPVMLSRNGRILYFTTNEDRLHALCLATQRIVASVPLPATSHFMALDPTGSRLYVATRAGGSVLEVDTVHHRVHRTFRLGGQPQGLAVSRNGRTLYVANEHHGLDVVSLPTGQRVGSVSLGGQAIELALSPDDRDVHVALVSTGAVAVVDRASLKLRTILPTGGRPRGMAFDPSGRVLVVANEAGWVDLLPANPASATAHARLPARWSDAAQAGG
jgi:DNA-binding beta-propeller fold protein YncE